MEPDKTIDDRKTVDAVVGVFDSPEDAYRVAASFRSSDLKWQNVSQVDPIVPNGTQEIDFYEIDEDVQGNLIHGMFKGGAIGAGSGLLLPGVPILNVAAPIIGALAGAWIGAITGIDESVRVGQVPNQKDYRRMLSEGKSFVVNIGDESKRTECGLKMTELGASEVHQHSPEQHLFWVE